MIGDSRLLAIVTARGQSKRLPRKNISNFNGQPLIAWSIKAGTESQYIDRLIVSTDDDEISQIAVAVGADVPFAKLELSMTMLKWNLERGQPSA